MKVVPGQYDRPTWFFTSRGTYELQVHIRGYPDTEKPNPISNDKSVTSDQRFYILHVGAEADLGVTTTVAPANSSPTNEVTITIAASNAGPDTAPSTKVDVVLPDGLTYKSHDAATGTTYVATNGVWTIGALAKDASKTLTVKATVDAETHGQALTANATISATEAVKITEENENGVKEVKTYHVPVPDPTPGNNTATGTTTVARIANVNPMFMVVRSVPENSVLDTNVGALVPVKDPEGNYLRFTLRDDRHDNFKAVPADGGVQIRVSAFEGLDYETKQSYDLTLRVSDGKDEAGNHDNWAIDDAIEVRIEITDVIDLALSASDTTPSFGEAVTWTASVGTLPAGATNVRLSLVNVREGIWYEPDRTKLG